MAKAGTKFDYDLMANDKLKGSEVCLICDNPLRCRWTDYHGEGVCLSCGAPYQLQAGSDKQQKEGKYPYLKLKPEWIPICCEYWQETHSFVFGGCSFAERTGQQEFSDWAKKKHPEMCK